MVTKQKQFGSNFLLWLLCQLNPPGLHVTCLHCSQSTQRLKTTACVQVWVCRSSLTLLISMSGGHGCSGGKPVQSHSVQYEGGEQRHERTTSHAHFRRSQSMMTKKGTPTSTNQTYLHFRVRQIKCNPHVKAPNGWMQQMPQAQVHYDVMDTDVKHW